jgi:hypothetical protein
MIFEELSAYNFSNRIILEEYTQGGPPVEQAKEESSESDIDSKIEPLNKFQLYSKIIEFDKKIKELNNSSDDLNILIKFYNDLDYNTCLTIFNNILDAFNKKSLN